MIGVDYRQGPEHVFPAATDDVVAVYKELLKTYPAANIGIYGCSAGGMLTGEVVYAHAGRTYLLKPGDSILFDSGALPVLEFIEEARVRLGRGPDVGLDLPGRPVQ